MASPNSNNNADTSSNTDTVTTTATDTKHSNNESTFQEINAADDIDRVTTLETVCLDCHEVGTTRLLLTRIPYFRDVILMSFECEQCNARYNELQQANDLQPTGIVYTLHIDATDDKEIT